MLLIDTVIVGMFALVWKSSDGLNTSIKLILAAVTVLNIIKVVKGA